MAVARRTGGAVLADGRTLLAPDPGGAVDLVLYAAHGLQPDDLLRAVRGLVAPAVLEPRTAAPGAPLRYGVVASTPYDGAVRVDVEHVDRVPRALGALEWRDYGPFAYRLRWLPPDPYELEVERPSALHVIARGRMRSLIARLALALRERATGELVDDGGFLVSPDEVRARLEPGATTAGAWV